MKHQLVIWSICYINPQETTLSLSYNSSLGFLKMYAKYIKVEDNDPTGGSAQSQVLSGRSYLPLSPLGCWAWRHWVSFHYDGDDDDYYYYYYYYYLRGCSCLLFNKSLRGPSFKI